MHSNWTSAVRRLVAGIGVCAVAGCSISDLVSTNLPPTTTDPEALKSETGAIALYRGAIWAFRRGFGGQNTGYVLISGRMSDELTTGAYLTTSGVLNLGLGSLNELDARMVHEDEMLRSSTVESWYRNINMGRNQAVDALYYLKTYAPFQPVDLQGHMYAIRGYALIYLADAFCSGIPLTDYLSPGGFVYRPGVTTGEVYEAAIAQFDSALALVPDSVRYRNLAQVGKARALVNLGRFQEAAQVTSGVPTSFQYKAMYAVDYSGSFSNNWTNAISNTSDPEGSFGTVGDREGGNGLPFVSSKDPRVPLVLAPRQSTTYPNTQYFLPARFFPNDAIWQGVGVDVKGGEDITLSSGIEARLMEAEVAAQAGDASFLTILNTLRTSCTGAGSCATPAPAGTGGVGGLPPLTDPGTRESRLRLVFAEKGYWLFLTGVRQGDLRRMVRVHRMGQETVYPTGFYPHGGTYGDYTNIPIPFSEQRINANYSGCIDRGA